ncbi:MAG: hypothetical protein NC210_06500 [[Clostridium] fimetarium]|nr:hypothetical protein [Alistipes timonensis]MCM1406053.1 hypothetical protein [[Clostridium] fimetarium]
MSERDITALLHSRWGAGLLMALAIAGAIVAYTRQAVVPIWFDLGLGLTAPGRWIPQGWPSLAAGLAANVGIGLLTLTINRTFNVLRSLTTLVAGLFFVMQLGLPSLLCQFYSGTLLTLLVLVCTALLFSAYGSGAGQRRVFLAFCLTTLAAFTNVSFALYLPVLLVGCAQMRIFNGRTLVAALLGVLTPPWLLIGFGIVRVEEIDMPRWLMAWSQWGDPHLARSLIVTGFTLFIGAFFITTNLMKILSYNSRVRAYNGFLTMTLIATALYTLFDFGSFRFYLPLLNCLTAYQAAHFFTYRRSRRSYIPILILILTYCGFYAWSLIDIV